MTYKSITIADALLSLRPNSQFCIKDNLYEKIDWVEPPVEDGGQELPSFEEVQAEVKRLEQEWENNQYQRLRKVEYPSIEDQLDLLYHQGYDGWKTIIEQVKLKYPKLE